MLEVSEVSVRFGGIVALDDLSFTIDRGQICGLIGPNGAGKTTLFNVVSRIYDPTWGAVRFEDEDLLSVPAYGIAGRGVARTFQNLALYPTMTILDNVMVGATSRSKINWVTAAFRIGAEKEDRQLRREAMEILTELELERFALHPATGLPYGTLKRIEIARAMAARPRLLLLDEPASGLTHSEVEELARDDPLPARQARAHDPARGAPHADGDGHLRQGRRPQLRSQDRGRHAGGGVE